MIHRKSPLFATAVSLIALSAVTGCAQTGSMFDFGSSPAHNESSNASYQAAMRVADDSRARGDLQSAVTFYARAAQFDQQQVAPLIELGDVFWQMKNPADSAKALEKARGIDPSNAAVLRGLGRAYVGLNMAKKAQEAYLAAMASDPSDARILNGLGIAYDLDGDHETAQSHYHAGLALSPTDLDLQNNLAYSYISARKYEDAVRILRPLVDRAGATPRQRQNLALAYGLMGREDEAREVAKADLNPAEVERNLTIYRQLRNETNHSRAMADIGRPGYTAAPGEEPAPEAAPAPAQVAEQVLPPPEPEIVGVPEGATLIKPPAPEPVRESAMASELAPETVVVAPQASVATTTPEPTVPAQPVDLVAAPAAPANALSAPMQTGLGTGKIYLGRYENEAIARETWIKVWTANSTTLGSLVASIEPNEGQMALYAVGAGGADEARDICLKLRQNGVSCGVSQ